MDDPKVNQLTYSQSLVLWWAIIWRSVVIFIVPGFLIGFLLGKGFGLDTSIVSLFQNLTFIAIMIFVQKYVINQQGFNGFEIKVKIKQEQK